MKLDGWRTHRSRGRPDAPRTSQEPFLRKRWYPSREQWRRYAFAGVLCWAGYSLILSPGGAIRLRQLQGESEQLDAQLARLQTAHDSLAWTLETLERGDPFLLERMAREEYGLARENERIYVLPGNQADYRCIDRATRPQSTCPKPIDTPTPKR